MSVDSVSDSSAADSNWKAAAAFDPRALVEARLQLHYAAQVVAAVGLTFLEPQNDDSHPNLGWRAVPASLAGHLVSEGSSFRAALRPSDLSLLLLDEGDVVVSERALGGATLDDAHDWMAQAIEAHNGRAVSGGLTRASYELPSHPLQNGACFDASDTGALAALESWFAGGHTAISRLVAGESAASPVRCWPHHFDIGTLIVVATDAQGALTQSVGIGLSPGDETYAEPYWYVTPWPYPAPDALAPLGATGHWRTKGFTAAILQASEQLTAPDAAAVAQAFLANAVVASRSALGA